jgi:hypothetical protein
MRAHRVNEIIKFIHRKIEEDPNTAAADIRLVKRSLSVAKNSVVTYARRGR